jgi:hypothetical protein
MKNTMQERPNTVSVSLAPPAQVLAMVVDFEDAQKHYKGHRSALQAVPELAPPALVKSLVTDIRTAQEHERTKQAQLSAMQTNTQTALENLIQARVDMIALCGSCPNCLRARGYNDAA